MQYKAISADGHVNEPPTLWVRTFQRSSAIAGRM